MNSLDNYLGQHCRHRGPKGHHPAVPAAGANSACDEAWQHASHVLDPRISRHGLGSLLLWASMALAYEHVLRVLSMCCWGHSSSGVRAGTFCFVYAARISRARICQDGTPISFALSFSRRLENQPCSCLSSRPMAPLICRRVRVAGSKVGTRGTRGTGARGVASHAGRFRGASV